MAKAIIIITTDTICKACIVTYPKELFAHNLFRTTDACGLPWPYSALGCSCSEIPVLAIVCIALRYILNMTWLFERIGAWVVCCNRF
jgi:hypothetical protein